MFSTVATATLIGVDPLRVDVDTHVASGHNRFAIVGLPDTAIREARDRVTSAMAGSGYALPNRGVVVGLAPADVRKTGSGFDLAIALSVLMASSQIGRRRVVALGELALDGAIRPTRGALAAAKVAAGMGVPCLVPEALAEVAALVAGADVRPVRSLTDAVAQLLADNPRRSTPSAAPMALSEDCDLSEVRGQPMARRAVEIAAAGGHHLLLSGAPGCGKTMLARRLPTILPPLTPAELLEVAFVWEASDRRRDQQPERPPFRAPHHTASAAGLLGGGSGTPVPGEATLAHRGLLFLDELGEFPANILDALRQPIEDGEITVSRRGCTVRFPARFQVVAATNPCPCGFRGDRKRGCRCSDVSVEKYRRRLSGPLLDRFDLRVNVFRPERLDMPLGEASAVVAERVARARLYQAARGRLNRDLGGEALGEIPYSSAARLRLTEMAERLDLGPRAYDRVRRVALTIADLAGSEVVDEAAVAEAVSLRGSW